MHPKERDNRAVGQRPDERALFERILDAGGLHDVGREQDPDQRQPLHLVGALAQHAPAQHRLAARLRPGERRARRADLALRVDARISAPAITRPWWRRSATPRRRHDHRLRLRRHADAGRRHDLHLGQVSALRLADEAAAADLRRAVDAARDDRARLRRHPRCRPRSCSPRSTTTSGCGPAWRRWRPSAAAAAGTSPSSATGSPSTSKRCSRRGFRSRRSSARSTSGAGVSRCRRRWRSRPARTSRAAWSPICARATPAIRWPMSATAGSTCRRRSPAIESSRSRAAAWPIWRSVAGRTVEEFEQLDEVAASL